MSDTPVTLLIVEDERDVREPLARYLSSRGYRALTAADGVEALEILERESVAVILTDMRMPRMGGMELLRKVKNQRRSIHVLMFTAYGTIETAVEALKAGAFDYALKPVIFEDIEHKLEHALRSLSSAEDETGQTSGLDAIVGESRPVKELKELIAQVALVDSPVVIEGESGVGKELVARALHSGSPRKNGPFIAVNCAAIPEQLLESELFGHVKGAFTGAVRDKKGFFELADKGSLLLDEITDLPLSLQAKLLRALETSEVYPVGGTKPVEFDMRTLSASGRSLTEQVSNGKFREDLYYRISVIVIAVPPLRDRTEDIPLLVDLFLTRLQSSMGPSVESFSPEALEALKHHSWPGNVRELRNVVERAAVLCRNDQVGPENLPTHITAGHSAGSTNLKTARRDFERDLILKTLESCGQDKKQAAQLLGIGVSSLYRKLEELGIE